MPPVIGNLGTHTLTAQRLSPPLGIKHERQRDHEHDRDRQPSHVRMEEPETVKKKFFAAFHANVVSIAL